MNNKITVKELDDIEQIIGFIWKDSNMKDMEVFSPFSFDMGDVYHHFGNNIKEIMHITFTSRTESMMELNNNIIETLESMTWKRALLYISFPFKDSSYSTFYKGYASTYNAVRANYSNLLFIPVVNIKDDFPLAQLFLVNN